MSVDRGIQSQHFHPHDISNFLGCILLACRWRCNVYILVGVEIHRLLHRTLLSGGNALEGAMKPSHYAIPRWEVSTPKVQVDAAAFLRML